MLTQLLKVYTINIPILKLKKTEEQERNSLLFLIRVEQYLIRASLVAQMVKHLPAMRETSVKPRGQEDPLEKEITTYSSILAWKIPWTEMPDGLYSPWGCKE